MHAKGWKLSASMYGVLVALILSNMPSMSCQKELSSVQVFYVPLNAETYMAVTPQSIDGERSCRLSTGDADKVRELLSTAAPIDASTHFDGNRVRVKIVERAASQAAVIFVDNEGIVRRGDGDYRLSPGARQKLKSTIENAFDKQ